MATESAKPQFTSFSGMYSNPSLFQGGMNQDDFLQDPTQRSAKKAFAVGAGSTSPAKEFYSSVWSLGDTMNNSAQAGQKGSDANVEAMDQVNQMQQGQNPLMEAFQAALKAYTPFGGRQIAGNEDISEMERIGGGKYRTQRVTPTEKHGIESGMGRLEGSTPIGDIGWKGPHSWEMKPGQNWMGADKSFGGGLHSWDQPTGVNQQNIAAQSRKRVDSMMPQTMIA